MAEKFCPFTKEACSENCQLYVKNTLYGNGCVFSITLGRLISIDQSMGKLLQKP